MKNIRLLIIDDDEDYMFLLKDLLKESDLSFEIDEVGSSKLALTKYLATTLKYLRPTWGRCLKNSSASRR